MKSFKILAVIAVLAFPSAAEIEGQTPPLTFSSALRRALENNPSAARIRSDINVAQSQRRLLRSAILPRIELFGSATRNSRQVEFGDGQNTTVILPRDDWAFRVNLSQPIYAGGRELKALRQAGLGIEDAEQSVRLREDQLLLQTAADYLGVIEGDALIGVEKQNLELARKRRKQSQDFVDAGETTKVDLLRADTAIKAAQRRLAVANQLRDSASSRLRLDLGMDGELEVESPSMSTRVLTDENTLVKQAVASHPAVRRAELAHSIAQLETRKQRGRYLPVLTADATYTRQKVNFPADNYSSFTLNLYVPLYLSGEVEAQIATARTREKQAELVLAEVRQQITEQVRLAVIDLRTAETNFSLAREQLTSAEGEYQQTFELYRAQEATSLDVDSAETSLAEARRAVVTGNIERNLAELRVLYSTGSLKDALLTEEMK